MITVKKILKAGYKDILAPLITNKPPFVWSELDELVNAEVARRANPNALGIFSKNIYDNICAYSNDPHLLLYRIELIHCEKLNLGGNAKIPRTFKGIGNFVKKWGKNYEFAYVTMCGLRSKEVEDVEQFFHNAYDSLGFVPLERVG